MNKYKAENNRKFSQSCHEWHKMYTNFHKHEKKPEMNRCDCTLWKEWEKKSPRKLKLNHKEVYLNNPKWPQTKLNGHVIIIQKKAEITHM